MELTLEVRITSRGEEPLAMTQEVASGDLDGEAFEVLQGVGNPLEWRIRTGEHVAILDLRDLVEETVRRM